MIDKYKRYDLEKASLLKNGFISDTLFFQIGGGEDEDDITIFMKEDFALAWDYITSKWHKCMYKSINYKDGFDWGNPVDINKYIIS